MTYQSKQEFPNLPQDFDWQYYLDVHPDLQRAGLSNEHHAISHYLVYGHKENRRYKPDMSSLMIQNIIAHQQKTHHTKNNTITVFLQWYDDEETEINRLFCLKKNIENQYIDHIHIFCENKSAASLDPIIISNNKVSTSNIDTRLTYTYWIEFANEHYAKDIKVLINSDIFFDDTIKILLNKEYNKHVLYSITRKDLDKNNNIIPSNDFYDDTSHPTNPLYSQDCWIYRDQLKTHKNYLFNYELGKGNCDRLFKKYLEKEKISFINLHTEINAIHVDHRTTKTRESYSLSDIPLIPINDMQITSYITKNDLQYYNNSLECICLLLTGKELENGEFANFIDSLIQSLEVSVENQFFAKKLEFKIYTQHHIDDNQLDIVKKYFKNADIIKIDIPKKYDFYNDKSADQDLTYGYKSGPNYAFFNTFQYLTTYNTTLFLECDVFFGYNWLERIFNYCRFSGSFMISGSTYDGNNFSHIFSDTNQHINGGVCLYATGNQLLISFMRFCFDITPYYVKYVLDHIPYDYVIYQSIVDYFDNDHDNRDIWKFINRMYVKNNLIFNFSTKEDMRKNEQTIAEKTNFALLHKKKDKRITSIEDIKDIPKEFDHFFYIRQYPHVKNYFDTDHRFSLRHKMYHHYLNYGQTNLYMINNQMQYDENIKKQQIEYQNTINLRQMY